MFTIVLLGFVFVTSASVLFRTVLSEEPAPRSQSRTETASRHSMPKRSSSAGSPYGGISAMYTRAACPTCLALAIAVFNLLLIMASLQGHLASQAEITPALPADGRSRHHQPESSGIESRLSADEDVASKHEDDSKDADDVAGATDVENKEFTMTDQTLRLPMLRVIIVMAAASSCVLLSFLDQTIVSSALPTISSYFNSGKQSSWVATAYLVSSTAASPLYGRFSDIFGRK